MIRIILEIIFFIFIFRLIMNFILPMILSFFAASKTKNYQQKNYSKPNGKIKIDYMPPKQENSAGSKAGEFVDYEEVK